MWTLFERLFTELVGWGFDTAFLLSQDVGAFNKMSQHMLSIKNRDMAMSLVVNNTAAQGDGKAVKSLIRSLSPGEADERGLTNDLDRLIADGGL